MTAGNATSSPNASSLALERGATASAAWRVPLIAWAASRTLVLLFGTVGSLVLGVPAIFAFARAMKPYGQVVATGEPVQ